MNIEIIKEKATYRIGKSYQMRIEFQDKFSDFDCKSQFKEELDAIWKEIGVYYFWHIGQNFVDGFFDDFNNMVIDLQEIIYVTEKYITKYEDNILTVKFKDIN